MKSKFTSASCSTCDTLFERLPVEYDEDGGYVFMEVRPCTDATCGKMLCSCCDQFHCDGCGQTFCADHLVSVPDGTDRPCIAVPLAPPNARSWHYPRGFTRLLRTVRFFQRRRPDMQRSCEWCDEPITFVDSQTTSAGSAWHTRCWNYAAEHRAAYIAECDDSEGFTRRPPCELPMSETGTPRSEVIKIMATAEVAQVVEEPKNNRNRGEKKMNEVVRFPINTPVEVTLQCETGKHVEGRYGDQVMYSLLDNRVMYVPPYVEQRFRELAIGAGEPLLLCKKEVKDNNRNRTEWSIRRVPEQPLAPVIGTADADAAPPDMLPGVDPTDRMETEKVNETAKHEEQPRANSTAPLAQESANRTNSQHQRQDSAEAPGAEVMLSVARPVEISAKDSVFLPAMSMEVALARRAAIVEFTRRIMVKDQDFGEIPGTNKPTLLKPGAEKLCNFFGLEPEFTPIVEDIDWTGAQHGGEVFCYARYRCRLLREGRVVGVGEGSCNSWEAKYRYPWVAEEQVPENVDRQHLLKRSVRRTAFEFDFAIERGETTGQYGKPAEHWQRLRDAIRAETARQVEKLTRRGNSVAWEMDVDTALYRIPNPDVADVVNTIQKMAQKRALVAATLIATSASEFFTQDVEDADPTGRRIDTGSHPHGTREAQEFVRDSKLAEFRSKPVTPGEADSAAGPWKNFGEMRQLFAQLREQVGELRYMEELKLAGVQNPSQFQSAAKAIACYWRLARIAAQPEVA